MRLGRIPFPTRAGLICLAMLLAGEGVRLAAQNGAEDLEGTPVVAVRHQPEIAGVPPLEPEVLARLTTQRAGEPYSASKIRESIERLYATGRFEDIRVDAEREPSGVVVTFQTRSRFFIGAVAVRGVAAPSEVQLRTATRLRLGYAFVEEELPAAMDGLREALQNEGFYRSQIAYRLQPHPERNQVDIIFEVRPGPRAGFGGVQITGTPVFPAARIVEQSRWEAGEQFTARRLQDGLSRLQDLYRGENYLEASLRIARRRFDAETNRLDLEVEVVAGPRIEITVTGANLDRSDMERLIPIFEERTLDEDLLREGERNLANHFESEGYFDVAVRYVRDPVENGNLEIEYQVELGTQQRLAEIRFRGNEYFRDETLRERMLIQPATVTMRNGRFSTNLLEQDLAAIRAVYQTNGFPRVRVTAQRMERDEESGGGMAVVITVDEGPQILVGEFTLTGNQAIPREVLEGYINAGSGQPYSEAVIASDRDNLLTLYFNEGFLEARFDWRATADEDGERNDLAYIIEEGPREYVRHVYVSGLEFTRVGIVNRQLQFRDGDPLSQGELIETQRRLYDLGIFSQVEMAVQNPTGTERDRTILVYLEEARRYTLKIGLGADIGRLGGGSGDVDDVEGKTEISPNVSFDITRLNVGGRPHTASIRTRFSTLQKRAGLTYLAPRFLNHPWLNASAVALFDESRDVRTFTARRLETSLQFETQWSRATTLLHRYAFRRVTLDESSLRLSAEAQERLGDPARVAMLSQTWLRDTRDDPTDSRLGMFSSVDLGVAAEQIGSQANFVRMILQNSSYHPWRSRFTIARSFQIGLLAPFGGGREVITERFFAGGGNSHRGFAVNQAGPRDSETGFAVGGNALLFHSIEMRFPLWGANLGGVLFHDMGNVFERVQDLTIKQHQDNAQDSRYLAHAVGTGLRYRTPIGPVRFDVGYNLNPTRVATRVGTSNEGVQTLSRWQFLVSIGQSF